MWAPRPSDVRGDTAVQQQIQFKGGLGGWVTHGIYVQVHTQACTHQIIAATNKYYIQNYRIS